MKRVIALILTICCTACFAQTNKPLQLEFPCAQYSTELQCLPCSTEGVCVFYPTYTTDSCFLNLCHYNINMEEVYRDFITIDPQLTYASARYDQGCVYLLYQNKNKKRREPEGLLVCYHCDTHIFETTEINNFPINDISQFNVLRGALFFVSATGRDNTNLFFGAAGQTFTKALYLHEAPDYTIDSYCLDTLNDKVMACVNTSSSTRNNVVWLTELTLQGEPLRVIDLPDTGSYRFQNARIAQIDSSRFLITGTYQARKGTLSNMAQGTYTTMYENGHFTEPRLYPFNSARAINTNGISDDVLYLIGKTYHDSTRYVSIAESFYPEYRYSTTYSYGVPTTEPIFVGYRFLNAEIRVFNAGDSLLWQYTFPFDNLLVTNLTTHLRADFIGSNLLLYFIQGHALTTMLVDEQMEIIDPIRTAEIFPNGKNSSSMVYNSGISRWYDNYFLLVGYKFPQSSSNKTKKAAYFINKLLYN